MHRGWIVGQAAAWLAGAAILACLVGLPRTGLHLLWDVLIPCAPLLFMLAPGVWRNLCPLATTSMLPYRLGLSARLRLPDLWQARLHLLAVVLLFALVPLRRAGLNIDGPMSAWALLALGASAVLMGFVFDAKSGWCASLCPVHPVERLYGTRPAVTVSNAHCVACQRCSVLCPESTPGMRPRMGRRSGITAVSSALLVGGFPGFIWGWFQVPDGCPPILAYGTPLAGLSVTLGVYLLLRRALSPMRHDVLDRGFAGAAAVCYYVYRLPALIGFSLFPGDGVLVDLTGTLPAWSPLPIRIAVVALLLGWFWRHARRRSWTRRPPYACDHPVPASPPSDMLPLSVSGLPGDDRS